MLSTEPYFPPMHQEAANLLHVNGKLGRKTEKTKDKKLSAIKSHEYAPFAIFFLFTCFQNKVIF